MLVAVVTEPSAFRPIFYYLKIGRNKSDRLISNGYYRDLVAITYARYKGAVCFSVENKVLRRIREPK
jgi:hypothetical protein